MSAVEDWLNLMEDRFPFVTSDGYGELAFVNGEAVDEELRATIRLIRFDDYDGSRMVRDIKEQTVNFGRVEHLEYLERYGELLRAMSTVFGDLSAESIDELMPLDLVPSDVFDLKARTFDEFGKALTRKSRLGKYLGD